MKNPLMTFTKNERGSDFVVGDIHGCYDGLMTALDKIDFDFDKDRLFACGDLVDRGNDSLKCLNLCYEPWFYSVRGNHEQMMFDVVARGLSDGGNWFYNGGVWAIDHLDDQDFKAVCEDLDERLPLGIKIERQDGSHVGVLHAEPEYHDFDENFSAFAIQKGIQFSLLWGRTLWRRDIHMDVSGVERIYVGHTPTTKRKVLGNIHYMDRGACFTDGGDFEIVNIEEVLCTEKE